MSEDFDMQCIKEQRLDVKVSFKMLLKRCPVPTIQNYIKRNYVKDTEKWGLWLVNTLLSFYKSCQQIQCALHDYPDVGNVIIRPLNTCGQVTFQAAL